MSSPVRYLVSIQIVAMIAGLGASIPAHAELTWIQFTVRGAPTDPIDPGKVAIGTFSFDRSILGAWGSSIGNSEGLGINSLDFWWGGIHWTPENADLVKVGSTWDGTPNEWYIWGRPNGVSSYGPLDDVMISGWPEANGGFGGFNYILENRGSFGCLCLTWKLLSPLVPVGLQISPPTLNRGSSGRFITAYLQPQLPWHASEIDLSSITLNGSAAPLSKGGLITDHNGDGVEDLSLKFAREALAGLPLGQNVVTVTGTMAGDRVPFEGSFVVEIIDPPLTSQLAVRIAPNPFNPVGEMTFRTASTGKVRLAIVDLRGRLVRTLIDSRYMPPGDHVARIDCRDDKGEELASGIYFYRLQTANGSATGRFTILK
jgi:hypothetical protein